MNIFNWMWVQWTSKLCPFHISKNIFWVQVHLHQYISIWVHTPHSYCSFEVIFKLIIRAGKEAIFISPSFLTLKRPGGGGLNQPPLWFFRDNFKTVKGFAPAFHDFWAPSLTHRLIPNLTNLDLRFSRSAVFYSRARTKKWIFPYYNTWNSIVWDELYKKNYEPCTYARLFTKQILTYNYIFYVWINIYDVQAQPSWEARKQETNKWYTKHRKKAKEYYIRKFKKQ